MNSCMPPFLFSAGLPLFACLYMQLMTGYSTAKTKKMTFCPEAQLLNKIYSDAATTKAQSVCEKSFFFIKSGECFVCAMGFVKGPS